MAQETAIKLSPIERQTIIIEIEGITPLIPHKWSEKARRMMREKQSGSKARAKHEPKDAEAEAHASLYLPDGWNRQSLQAIIGLRKVSTRRGVESINLRLGNAISAIDDVIEENAEKALAPSSLSLGAVRGRLYRYTNDTVRKRRSAGLRRTDTGEAIELRFAPDDAAKVRAHLERDVEVWGEITRDATGQVAQLVVEGIEPIDAPGQGASASEGRGLLGSDWAGGIDPAEWVRTMRGLARLGGAGQGMAGAAWRGEAGLGGARLGTAWQARQGLARRGKAGHGKARQGVAGMAGLGGARLGRARQGSARRGRHGGAWRGAAGQGEAWHGRQGKAITTTTKEAPK